MVLIRRCRQQKRAPLLNPSNVENIGCEKRGSKTVSKFKVTWSAMVLCNRIFPLKKWGVKKSKSFVDKYLFLLCNVLTLNNSLWLKMNICHWNVKCLFVLGWRKWDKICNLFKITLFSTLSRGKKTFYSLLRQIKTTSFRNNFKESLSNLNCVKIWKQRG